MSPKTFSAFVKFGILMFVVVLISILLAYAEADADVGYPWPATSTPYPGPQATPTWDCNSQYVILEQQWKDLLLENSRLMETITALEAIECIELVPVDPDFGIGEGKPKW